MAKLASRGPRCAFCGESGFTVLDRLFEMREFEGGDLVIDGRSSILPVVVLACNTCGELRMLSAIKLGIIDTSEKRINDEKGK